jgi:transcriptional regulator with XRE-family HTH domain
MLHSSLAIGTVIKRLRKRHPDNLTQGDLADALGMTRQGYNKLERGLVESWTRDRLQSVCTTLGITLDKLSELAAAEDERLDNPTRAAADHPDDAERHARYMASVNNPILARIERVHQQLLTELPPKTYAQELVELARRHNIDV